MQGVDGTQSRGGWDGMVGSAGKAKCMAALIILMRYVRYTFSHLPLTEYILLSRSSALASLNLAPLK
jgi:hypothetical protein